MLLVFLGGLAVLGHGLFLTCALPSSNPISPSSMSSWSVSPFVALIIQLRSYGSSSLGPVFHAHPSCRQRVELLQLNVTRFPLELLLKARLSQGLSVSVVVCRWSSLWSLLWATHGLPCRAPVYRGCPCRDTPVCHRVQGDNVESAIPSLCGCWCWSRDIMCSLCSRSTVCRRM